MPSVTLSDVITAAMRQHAANTHTAIPGKVVSWDPATNTADVQIMIATPIYDLNGERSFEDPPVVPAVPILWPRGGGFVVTVPLAAGDFVWLMFSEASLAEFRTTGQVSEPTDARRHSFGHAYAIPGAFPDVEPLAAADATKRASAMIVGADGGPAKVIFEEDKITMGDLAGGFLAPIEITATGIKLNSAAIDAVALATPTLAGLTACVGAVNALTAAVAAMVTAYNSHTHAVATTGTAAAQTGTAAATGATMAAAPGATGAPSPVAALTVKAL